MYDLVADVAKYPEFLPWTAAARIRSDEDRGDHRVMDADLVISFKVFRERFTVAWCCGLMTAGSTPNISTGRSRT